jgi:hypothetical protein
MAKDKKKGKKKKDSAGPRDAVRGAVESTFQKAAGGASRAQELLDDLGTTLRSLREANLVETLESVRDEVQTLARRVAALELREKPAPPARPAVRRASTSTARKPAARKTSTTASASKPAARKPAARKTSTTASASKPAARKPTARKTTAASASKPAARKPATRKPAARKPAARKPASS